MLRLLLALLVACLSTPAIAAPACHAPPRAAAEGSHGHHQAPAQAPDERATPAHVCIGCVPPDARLNAGAIPALVAEPGPVVGLTTQLAGRSIAPAIPPPRS